MSTSALHSVSVAAVITNEVGEVLMIQRRDNGHWEPPGGVLELHESIIDGLKREIREETGLQIEPGQLTGVYKNIPRGIVALVFRAKLAGGALAGENNETAAVAWLSRSAIAERCDEAYAIRIVDALSGAVPIARAHDGVRLIPT